jgi:hypothetical protein
MIRYIIGKTMIMLNITYSITRQYLLTFLRKRDESISQTDICTKVIHAKNKASFKDVAKATTGHNPMASKRRGFLIMALLRMVLRVFVLSLIAVTSYEKRWFLL